MSATGDGSSHYLATVGTIAGPSSAYSYSCWYYPLHVPNNTGVRDVLSIKDGTNYEVDFIWDHTDSNYYRAAVHVNPSGGTNTILHMPTNPAANQWVHFVITYDGTTMRMYYQGLLWSSGAAASAPASGKSPVINLLSFSGPQFYLDGSLANVGIWSVALSATDALNLYMGTDPTTIQNASLLFYNPLNTGVASPVGPTVTNHSTVINTTYFAGTVGAIEMGGSGTTVFVHYHESFAGGIAMKASLAPTIYTWAMTGGIEAGGSFQNAYGISMHGGIKAGGSGTVAQVIFHGLFSGGIKAGGSFQVSHLVGNNAFIVAENRELAFTSK